MCLQSTEPLHCVIAGDIYWTVDFSNYWTHALDWLVGKAGEREGVLLPLKGLNVRHYTCFGRSAHPLPKPSSPPRCTFQSCPSSNAPLASFPRERVIDHLKDGGGRSDRPAFWLVPNWDNYLPTCYLSPSIKIILHNVIYFPPVI